MCLRRTSSLFPILLVLAATALSATLGAQTRAGDSLPASDTRQTALQSCPAIVEEIVDLEMLAKGLKKSKAVGLVEKIRLKSSINDILERFEAFHDGARDYTLEQLQEQYDVLLMRIASHLQQQDERLHGQLCNAWDIIWHDLENPGSFAEKFS